MRSERKIVGTQVLLMTIAAGLFLVGGVLAARVSLLCFVVVVILQGVRNHLLQRQARTLIADAQIAWHLEYADRMRALADRGADSTMSEYFVREVMVPKWPATVEAARAYLAQAGEVLDLPSEMPRALEPMA